MASAYERYRDTLRDAHLAALTGQHAEAIVAYREAAAMHPTRIAPLVGIGRAELALGRPGQARTAFEAALAIAPDDVEAQRGRARAIAAMGSTASPGAARPDDDPAVRAVADRWEAASIARDVDGLLEVAVELARTHRDAAAATAVREALAIGPGTARVYRIAAWLDRRLGRREEAGRMDERLERYLEVVDDPDALERAMADGEAGADTAALLEVAASHRLRHRPRSALEAATSALAIAPTDVEVHLAIARVHLSVGRRARAMRDLAQLARYLEVADDRAGRARLAAFVNGPLASGAGFEPL